MHTGDLGLQGLQLPLVVGGGRIVYANRSHNVQRSALVGQASKGGCGPVEPLVGLYESDAHEDMVGLGQPE